MLTMRRPRGERGAVAIMVAVLASALFLIAALVVDLGLARDTKRQSQNASDAAALAAANVLYPKTGSCTIPANGVPPCYTDAISAAKSYAATNFQVTAAQWAGCTDEGHFYYPAAASPCISFTDDSLTTSQPSQPTKVRVRVPVRSVGTGFGQLAGISDIAIDSFARAAIEPGEARSCGLCILGSGTSPLGNGDVTVNGGSVFSNGSVDTGPNGHMTVTPAPNTISTAGTCTGNCSPTAQQGLPSITDPYASVLNLPLDKGTLTAKTNPCTQGPGIYGALDLPNSICDLGPGTYFLTGVWSMNNNTVLRGTGVTLYGTCGTTANPVGCSAGQSGGGLDGKNGDTQLTAPLTGPLAGIVIIYDRQNTAPLNLQGNGDSAVTGAVYALSSQLQFPGNSYFSVTNGPVIVGSLYGNGNTGGVNLLSVTGANLPAPPGGVALDQ